MKRSVFHCIQRINCFIINKWHRKVKSTIQTPTPSSPEIIAKANKYKSKDPFPTIASALLNSADIEDYIKTIGMVEPYDRTNLKSASYAICLLGKYVYWDEKGKKIVGEIEKGQKFILNKNSIAFVTLQPFFRFPDYIAARFNLKINNVYRGLLLGTGPLVDPGFWGRLSIPLHNLTSNDYVFTGGEQLIWMEFTKLSPINAWLGGTNEVQTGQYESYPINRHTDDDVEDYLNSASAHHPSIQSSIPVVFQNAERAAKKANRTVNLLGIATIIALVTIMLSLFAVMNHVDSTFERSNKLANQAQSASELLLNEISLLKSNNQNVQSKINSLEQKLDSISKKNDKTSALSNEKKRP
jgi:deoxycytidine triphosphate deaminase